MPSFLAQKKKNKLLD